MFSVNAGDACAAGAPPMVPIVTGGAGGSATLIVIDPVAVFFCESVTVKVTVAFPAAVGVPPIVLPATDNPAGRPLADQVYDAPAVSVPPVAASASVNAVPTVAGKLPLVVIDSAGPLALMVTLSLAVAVCPAASVTVTEKTLVPVAVGVPLITPELVFRLRPGGVAPEVTDQVYGWVPPLAAMVLEYAAPWVPLGSESVVIDSVNSTVIVNAFDTV